MPSDGLGVLRLQDGLVHRVDDEVTASEDYGDTDKQRNKKHWHTSLLSLTTLQTNAPPSSGCRPGWRNFHCSKGNHVYDAP
jgi:hypothetical protein